VALKIKELSRYVILYFFLNISLIDYHHGVVLIIEMFELIVEEW